MDLRTWASPSVVTVQGFVILQVVRPLYPAPCGAQRAEPFRRRHERPFPLEPQGGWGLLLPDALGRNHDYIAICGRLDDAALPLI